MLTSISSCCLEVQPLPEKTAITLDFQVGVAADPGNYGASVQISISKEGLTSPIVIASTLGAGGELDFTLTQLQANYLSRFGGEYTLEVFRTDDLTLVELREAIGQDTTYKGLCFRVAPCLLPIPDPYPVEKATWGCEPECDTIVAGIGAVTSQKLQFEDATYYYYSYTIVSSGSWEVRRYLRTDVSIVTTANVVNNPAVTTQPTSLVAVQALVYS